MSIVGVNIMGKDTYLDSDSKPDLVHERCTAWVEIGNNADYKVNSEGPNLEYSCASSSKVF
jgi:hypothetical protein